MKQGIIESISVRHVGRLLEEAELKPHALPLPVQDLRIDKLDNKCSRKNMRSLVHSGVERWIIYLSVIEVMKKGVGASGCNY